jgi:hypothetical protein
VKIRFNKFGHIKLLDLGYFTSEEIKDPSSEVIDNGAPGEKPRPHAHTTPAMEMSQMARIGGGKNKKSVKGYLPV